MFLRQELIFKKSLSLRPKMKRIMFKNRTLLYHLITLFTVIVWGTTFVSTKVLLQHGLEPAEIMVYRFVLAYVCMLFLSHKRLWADTLRDEMLFILLGITGGSLYFLAENTAIKLTQASNVAILVAAAPMFTALLNAWVDKVPLRRNLLIGSVVAMIGVVLVVLNGSFLLEVNPLGDGLSLVAASMWAFYCLILKRLDNRYDTLFITRKVFIYGILSLLVYFVFDPAPFHANLLIHPTVALNLVFLGIVASMICYITWNIAVKELGPEKASNYLYVQPLVASITSVIVLSETITLASVIGALCIVFGVYWTEKH